MTFAITPETGIPLPPLPFGRMSYPCPFGLNALRPGQSAFIPLTAYKPAKILAGHSTKLGIKKLTDYLGRTCRSRKDLKIYKYAIRSEGLGARVFCLS